MSTEVNEETELTPDSFQRIATIKDPDSDYYTANAILKSEAVIPLDGTRSKSASGSKILAEGIISKLLKGE